MVGTTFRTGSKLPLGKLVARDPCAPRAHQRTTLPDNTRERRDTGGYQGPQVSSSRSPRLPPQPHPVRQSPCARDAPPVHPPSVPGYSHCAPARPNGYCERLALRPEGRAQPSGAPDHSDSIRRPAPGTRSAFQGPRHDAPKRVTCHPRAAASSRGCSGSMCARPPP